MKIFSGLFGLILLAFALAFAISNRQTASVSLWPFDFQIDAPLYLLTLGIFLLGLLIGATFAWVNMLPHQLTVNRLRKDIGNLHDKMEELQSSIAPAQGGAYLPTPKSRWRFWRKS